MIETLRRLALEVAHAPDLATALRVAVRLVRDAMQVDACAIYLVDPKDRCLVLMETEGLNRAAIGQVRLAPGEGVLGLVRERREPVLLDNASEHPQYRYFPVTGEGHFNAFLGVPIVHYRQVIGVLAVFQRGAQTFGGSQEAFLVTVSAQLSGPLAEVITASRQHLISGQSNRHKPYLQGVPGAPGVAIGTVVTPSPLAELDGVPDRTAGDIEAEVAAFRDAVTEVQNELKASGERMKDLLPAEAQSLFEVYALLVGDDSLNAKVTARIREGQWAPSALRDTIHELSAVFDAMQDERLRARAEDIRAIGRRLLLELQVDTRAPHEFPDRAILVGDEVSLARIADVPRHQLAGVVCFKGSVLAHTVVVARALGIPAVMGLGDVSAERLAGSTVVVDGYRGRVFVDPSPTVKAEFERLEREERELSADLLNMRDLPAETPDGVQVPLFVNTGLLTDISVALKSGAAGVGLYRSEFPFMLRDAFPSEEEQRATYREMLEAFAPHPVVMRTLDIGGDKPLPYFTIDEGNSLLGWRGIRVTLQHPEIFLAQLKAMLRASVGLDNLRVLLPMVSSSSEVREARALLERTLETLSEEGLSVRRPELGVMIEVPAAIFALADLAEIADFFSIGTNDLTQYLLAVDRGNPRVAALYDHLHPAVLRAVRQVVTEARNMAKPVSLCGELAGDPVGMVLMLAMGVDYVSVAASVLPQVKWVIRSIPRHKAQELLEQSVKLPDAGAVRRLIHRALDDAGLGGLLRAGR